VRRSPVRPWTSESSKRPWNLRAPRAPSSSFSSGVRRSGPLPSRPLPRSRRSVQLLPPMSVRPSVCPRRHRRRRHRRRGRPSSVVRPSSVLRPSVRPPTRPSSVCRPTFVVLRRSPSSVVGPSVRWSLPVMFRRCRRCVSPVVSGLSSVVSCARRLRLSTVDCRRPCPGPSLHLRRLPWCQSVRLRVRCRRRRLQLLPPTCRQCCCVRSGHIKGLTP
jgi:hypothetical protein